MNYANRKSGIDLQKRIQELKILIEKEVLLKKYSDGKVSEVYGIREVNAGVGGAVFGHRLCI